MLGAFFVRVADWQHLGNRETKRFESSSGIASNEIMAASIRKHSGRCCFAISLISLTSLFSALMFSSQVSFAQSSAESSLDSGSDRADLLSPFGIESSRSGIEAYLESLLGDVENQREIAERLVGRLSDRSYAIREQATRELIAIPTLRISILKSLGSTLTSREGQYRLEMVIDARKEQSQSRVQFAVFRTIELENMTGLTPSIIESHRCLEADDFVQRAARTAIEVSSTPQDLELLQKVLSDVDRPVALRAGCLAALSRIEPERALQRASDLVGQSGVLGLEIARILVEKNRPESLDALVNLLDDGNSRVKFTALESIRQTTELTFANNALRDAESVSRAKEEIESWRIENADREIEYRWPKSIRLGRRLLSQYSKGRIVELDESGEIIWSVKAKSPFACIGLPNGHRLVVLYSSNKVVQYDSDGAKVGEFVGLPGCPTGLCLESDGNLWVAAGQSGDQILKFSPEGKKVKTLKVAGKPTSIEIGINGNFVCAMYGDNRIVELNSAGKVVHTTTVKEFPYHAQPLSNGNFLVAFPKVGEIAEYTRDGKLVWEHRCEQDCYRAQRLEDGSIVFADAKGVHRIGRDGKTIEFKDIGGKYNYLFSY